MFAASLALCWVIDPSMSCWLRVQEHPLVFLLATLAGALVSGSMALSLQKLQTRPEIRVEPEFRFDYEQMMLQDKRWQERAERLLEKPLIKACLPIRFANGLQIDTFIEDCPQCEEALKIADMHGLMWQPLASVVELEAAHCCEGGKKTHYLRVRFYDDGRYLRLDFYGGWEEWQFNLEPPKKNWWHKLVSAAKRLWAQD